MKRTLSLVLALVMVLGSFGTVFAQDEPMDTVEAGAFLETVGVLEGDDDGNLMLTKTLLRRDMVVLLSRLMGVEEVAAEFPSEGVYDFEDITDPYYNGYIAWSVSNELIEGHSSTVFGFNENVTAQQYVTVLMRALGYEVDDMAYVTILDTADDLGICEGLDLENDDQILRGQMALLTYNALGTEMKDSEVTLAESLGIEMPEAAEAKDLKVERVYSESLREVLVELSNVKLADMERLEEANNYRVDGNTAKRVTVMDNTLIIELKETLDEDDEYDLKIRNIHNDVDGTYKFTARDNAIPRVEEVEVLGKYGIKVTLSEPVIRAYERDFLIDGRNVSMKTEQYGRVIILTPYSGSFSNNIEELTVESLEDFAGFKSARASFDIEMVEDEVAPEVTDVIVRGDVVEVTFDKDIYKESVEEYENRSNVGNISYREGRRTFYAEEGAEKTDVNKVEYTFEEELPRNATVTIEGVENHSGVAMERTTQDVREVLDYTEPEIIDTDVETNIKAGNIAAVEMELTFNKDVRDSNGNDIDEDDFDMDHFEDHFALYKYGEVRRGNDVTDQITESTITVKYDGSNKDVVLVEFEFQMAARDVQDDEFDYVVEVKNFEDAKSRRNRMFREYIDFEVDEEESFVVEEVKLQSGRRRDEREIVITFSKEVDRRTADVLENYIFEDIDGNILDLDDLDGEVEYQKGSEEVVLVIPDYDEQDLETIELSRNIKDDEDGIRLSGYRKFSLITGQVGDVVNALDVTNVAADVYNKDVTVTAEVYNYSPGTKATIVITPDEDLESDDITINNVDITGTPVGTVNETIENLPVGTHSLVVKVGTVTSEAVEFTIVPSDDVSVSAVTVDGEDADVDPGNERIYNVELPNGTDLTELTASDIQVDPADDKANAGTPVKVNDNQWIVPVIAEDGTTVQYTINITVEL